MDQPHAKPRQRLRPLVHPISVNGVVVREVAKGTGAKLLSAPGQRRHVAVANDRARDDAKAVLPFANLEVGVTVFVLRH